MRFNPLTAAERAARRIYMLLGRGRVLLTKDDKAIQFVQATMSAKETMDLPRMAEFGFTSRMPANGDCIAIFLNAERSNGVIVATNHQTYRFKLENDGEVALYDAFGRSLWFKKNGGIVLNANNTPLEIDAASKVTVNAGDDGAVLNTTGDVTLNMGGKNLVVNNPGAVQLTGAGGRKVVCDGDPVVAGVCRAAAGQKVTAT